MKKAFKYSLPVMAGYLILGFGFGLLLASKGYNTLWAFAMSLFIYAGSMQYVCVDLLSSGATLISTALVTLMVNARHIFYGISMLVKYRNTGKGKPYLIFGLTDEVYSVVSHVELEEKDKKSFYFTLTLLCHLYWITGSVAGAVFGTIVPINTKGVDFSMTALFLVIVVDNLLHEGKRMTSLIGIGCSVVCLIICGPDNFLIPSMILISLMLAVFKGKLEGENIND